MCSRLAGEFGKKSLICKALTMDLITNPSIVSARNLTTNFLSLLKMNFPSQAE